MDVDYDLCIIGAGMFGSAAARHATTEGNLRVCLVGPKEPTDRQLTDTFASHYDEGRITRSTDQHEFWALAARRAIGRYRDIEQQSGIPFYTEAGNLTVAAKISDYTDRVRQSAQGVAGVQYLSDQAAQDAFPYMTFSGDNLEYIYESRDAGHINPRKLVQAQQTIAAKQGCTILTDIVEHISEHSGPLTVTCQSGRVIRAAKVLLATGAFTNFRRLLPSGVSVDIRPVTQVIALWEIRPQDMAKFSNMPCVLYTPGQGADATFGCYIVPPVKYPDGKFYLKMGDTALERELPTQKAVVDWFQSPAPVSDWQYLNKLLHQVFPDVRPTSIAFSTCVFTTTATSLPFIDLLTPRLGLVTAGNGYAAKSSDEMGRLAVELLLKEHWDCPLSRNCFKAIPKPGSRL